MSTAMEPNHAKRRKTQHSREGARKALGAVASSGGLSKSRAFILEADELLEEISLDYGAALEGVDDLLRRIKGSIEAIEPRESLPVTVAASKLEKKHRIRVPFPEPRPAESSNYKVAFAQPAQFNVVGSYVSKTMVKTQKDHSVDMVVVMPAELFQEKDYLDMRYFYKRAYYLAIIAVALQKDFGSDADLSYEYLNGNALCPIFSLRPKLLKDTEAAKEKEAAGLLNYRIRIIPCSPDAVFPKTKLRLGAALLRKGKEEDAEPSPFYNSTLAAEGCFLPYLRLLRQAEKKCAAFKSACILGRVWLQQRGFGGDLSEGGFGNFEWAVLLALLLQGGDSSGHATLSGSLSSTQLFKAMIQFLSVTNFAEKPCVLGAGSADLDSAIELGPVIYDSSRQLNIAFKMNPGSAAQIHQHAKWTRTLLNDTTADQFTPSFILKSDLALQNFDLVARLNFNDEFNGAVNSDCRGKIWGFSDKVYKVLRAALADKELGERARLIHIQNPRYPQWSLTENPSFHNSPVLEIGILFDSVNMARTVDRGPAAGPTAEEKEECDRFRAFWDEKAELRRFERDTIRETVIWNSVSAFDLCEEIMRYVFRLHLRVGHVDDEVTFFGDSFSSLLPFKPTDTSIYYEAKKAFSVFERDIRDLEDLPLHVRNVSPICPELRHASAKPPSLTPSKSGPRPMEAVISFEASGKWPESLVAIQRTKVAFLLMIASLLEKSKPGKIKAYVGLDDAKSEAENLSFLDVVYDSGAAFRLRIHSDLEEILLERQVKDKSLEQHVRTRTTALLATFRRQYTHLPLHGQSISTSATRFPALSPTIRLLKHWFNVHKLAYHFSEEFIELVVLNVFRSPYPWDAPSSASTGLLRALLFLARWDWRSEPLIVDTGGDMPMADRHAIGTRLEAWRKIDPNMNHTVLFVATTHDASGIAYTTIDGHAKPSKVVAARMTALAKSACRLVKEEGVELDPRRLFVPSLKDYDVLIKLNSKLTKSILKTYTTDDPVDGGGDSTGRSKFKNLDERTGQDALPLAQHPTETLLKQLNEVYAGPLVFFHGAAEDATIGAIWNPLMQKRGFRVNLPTSYRPVGKANDEDEGEEEEEDEEKDVVEVNREAIVAEIARIGADLIESIDVKRL
ncbi:Nrap protein [Bombardia bombarda]|uniref:U3 small nucleolar RNA-associated protein 22 n=1 Tax=Bombardia bombarda TaxID=252184 RepID=A0AA39X105_9PEZI|nr:Nrap protein [Bombardia bombarda]